MKKLLFITLLFCGLSFSAQSQSLTYSKVILLTALDTVPQGKVWKVVSYQPVVSSNSHVYMDVNGVQIHLYAWHYQSGGAIVEREMPLPMWLPSGTVIENNSNLCYSLSIIEFTENNE